MTDEYLMDLYREGRIGIADLPPHLKWTLPRKSYTVDSPYQDPGVNCAAQPFSPTMIDPVENDDGTFSDMGSTDESMAADADVNNIVRRATQTGVMPGDPSRMQFMDLSDVPSYQESMQRVINAQSAFMGLDATVRKRFDNDPAKFLAFLHDPNNTDEAVKLGLATTPSPTTEEAILGQLKEANELSKKRLKTKKSPPRQPAPDSSSKDD